jgi:1-acyl-sn-glycerol-3-phosphate acyltransferase
MAPRLSMKREYSEPTELVAARHAMRAVKAVKRGSGAVDVVKRKTLGSLAFPLRAPSVPSGVEVPPEPSRVGLAFDTEWARSSPARVTRMMIVNGPLKLALAAVAAPHVSGTDRLDSLARLDPTPPVIFAGNHHSHLDASLLLAYVPEPWRHRMVVGAAADYFFPNRFAATASALALGAFPIERTKVNRKSSDTAAELIDEGWSLAIFPEGGRSPDGWGQPFKGGAAYLALRCGVPVVPVHLAGAGDVLGKGDSRPTLGKVRLTFGQPIWPSAADDIRSLGARIEQAIEQLADENATDSWTAARNAAAKRTPTLQGPSASAWRRDWLLESQRQRNKAGSRRRTTPDWPRLSE